jgi:CheY-like chemotaxis protein
MASNNIDFILLIDDDKTDNKESSQTIKRELSKNVKSLYLPVEALTYFEKCLSEEPNVKFPVPDLVFLDLFMPVFNGFELLDEFRKLPDPYGRRKKMKFILVTMALDRVVGRGIYLKVEEHYSDLIIACVQKPLEPELLQEIARTQFDTVPSNHPDITKR